MKRPRAANALLPLITTTLFPHHARGSCHRKVWLTEGTGDPYWTEGDPFPTPNEVVNNFLQFSELTCSIVFNAVGKEPTWNNENSGSTSMVGLVQSSVRCEEYNDAYFNPSTNGDFFSLFCPGMTTAFMVGHEWGHGYAMMSGLQPNRKVEEVAVSEFVADMMGFAVQELSGAPPSPNSPRGDGCSMYGENNFDYISGDAGTEDSKRWLVMAGCEEDICPSRDMWMPECFGAAGRTSSPNYLCGEGENEQSGRAKRTHMNNGVPNHAFALLVDGGAYNNRIIEAIGLHKTVRIVLEAIYAKNTPTFKQLAYALSTSCQMIIGEEVMDLVSGEALNESFTESDCLQVENALNAVEMYCDPLNCETTSGPTLPTSESLSHLSIRISEVVALLGALAGIA